MPTPKSPAGAEPYSEAAMHVLRCHLPRTWNDDRWLATVDALRSQCDELRGLLGEVRTHLDLDDVAHGHPVAERELAELRSALARAERDGYRRGVEAAADVTRSLRDSHDMQQAGRMDAALGMAETEIRALLAAEDEGAAHDKEDGHEG